MVKTIGTLEKINAILLNVNINQLKLVVMCVYIGNKWREFHENILSLSENIAKSFRGYFLTHTVHVHVHALNAALSV